MESAPQEANAAAAAAAAVVTSPQLLRRGALSSTFKHAHTRVAVPPLPESTEDDDYPSLVTFRHPARPLDPFVTLAAFDAVTSEDYSAIHAVSHPAPQTRIYGLDYRICKDACYVAACNKDGYIAIDRAGRFICLPTDLTSILRDGDYFYHAHPPYLEMGGAALCPCINSDDGGGTWRVCNSFDDWTFPHDELFRPDGKLHHWQTTILLPSCRGEFENAVKNRDGGRCVVSSAKTGQYH